MNPDLPDKLSTAIREGRSSEVSDLLTASKLSRREMRDCLYGAVLYNRTDIALLLLSHRDFLPKERRCPYLYMSALTGNMEITAELLKQVMEIDKFLAPFLLEHSVKESSKTVIDLLLEKGVTINTLLEDQLTAIHIAAETGNLAIIEYLLQKGANANAWFPDSRQEICPGTLLHHAVETKNAEMVSLFLKYGAKIDEKDSGGSTPIYVAVEKGLALIVSLLIQAKTVANQSSKDTDDQLSSLLHTAVASGHAEVVKVLLESKINLGFLVNRKTAYQSALESGQIEVVKVFLSHGAKNKDSRLPGLHQFATDGDAKSVEALLRCGASVDSKNDNGRTPLFLAAKNGHDATVLLLKDHGADINYKNEKGWTPLHFFATGMDKGVACLLRCGAWVDPKDTKGRTPLYFAAQNSKDEIVKLLLKHGADVDLTDVDGATALSVAALKDDASVLAVLLKSGAKIVSKAFGSLLYELLEKGSKALSMLLKHGAKFSSKTESDQKKMNYFLYNEAGKGNVEIVEGLLRSGADVNSTLHPEKQTPLFAAAKFGRYEVIKLLLDSGAEVDHREMHGETPLSHTIPPEPHVRPNSNCCDCIKMFLEYGAQIDAADYSANRNTPLSLAAEKYWSPEVLQTLLEHGPIDAPVVRESNMQFLFHTVNKYGPICHMVMINIPSHGISTAEILVRHTIKMKAAKLYADTDNFKATTFCKPAELKKFLTTCEKEVALMRKRNIGASNISFYDILTKSPYQVARFLKSDGGAPVVIPENYKNLFPIYANNLRYQIEKGNIRNRLLDEGVKILTPAVKRFADVPGEIIEKILDYLPNSDLRSLIRTRKIK